MFGLKALDVAIGIVFFFLFASLICSAIREGLESILKMRALDLERAIRELLADPDGTTVASKLFDHPMISALFLGKYDPGKLKDTNVTLGKGSLKHMRFRGRRNLPSYIPAANFAQALLSLLAQGALPGQTSAATGTVLSAASIRASIGTINEPKLQQALLSAFDLAKDDLDAMRTNLENWFNSSMDRVSGWYKRRTQLFLFLIGLAAAAAFNLDAVSITRHMVLDDDFRALVVKEADAIVVQTKAQQKKPTETAGESTQDGTGANAAPPSAAETGDDAQKTAPVQPELSFDAVQEKLEAIGFPVGWRVACPKAATTAAPPPTPPAPPKDEGKADKKPAQAEACTGTDWRPWSWEMPLGWLVTAIAVMFGAPFWFDVLNKLVTLRAAGREPPKDGTKAADGKKKK